MEDLRALDSCKPQNLPVIPAEVAVVSTPLVYSAWAQELASHPDREFVDFVLAGISQGFWVGFRYGQTHCASAMLSPTEHPQPIDDYLAVEVSAGRIVGPLPAHLESAIQINIFGVIPKPHQPGKWRLITDLSHPKDEC